MKQEELEKGARYTIKEGLLTEIVRQGIEPKPFEETIIKINDRIFNAIDKLRKQELKDIPNDDLITIKEHCIYQNILNTASKVYAVLNPQGSIVLEEEMIYRQIEFETNIRPFVIQETKKLNNLIK